MPKTTFLEIEWIFFDATGTLFSLNRPLGEIYLEEARRFDFQPEPGEAEELEKAFRKLFRAKGPLTFPDAEPFEITRLERRWWHRLVKEVFKGRAFPRFEAYFNAMYEKFATDQFWALEPGAARVVRKLAGSGFRLGVISNFDSRLLRVLSSLGIRPYFQSVVFSSLAPSAKPGQPIFEFALFRAGALPGQGLHVGNSLQNDYQGAVNAGMKALLYRPASQGAGGEVPEGVDTITDLAELLDLLL